MLHINWLSTLSQEKSWEPRRVNLTYYLLRWWRLTLLERDHIKRCNLKNLRFGGKAVKKLTARLENHLRSTI